MIDLRMGGRWALAHHLAEKKKSYLLDTSQVKVLRTFTSFLLTAT